MFGTLLRLRNLILVVSVGVLAACFGGGSRVVAIATAKQIETASELIGGPNATGRVGDFLLQNDRIRVIIQNSNAPAATPFSSGGNLIDADRVRFPGEQGGDRFGGSTILLNGVRTVRAKKVFILEDGSATGYAVIRAEGDDAPYQGLTLRQFASSVSVPVNAADRDTGLDLLVKTDYILRPGANYVEVRTTFLNRRSAATSVVVGDIIDNGSTVPFISAGKGFGLPASPELWSATLSTLILEAQGLSYGYYLGREQVIESADKRSRSAFVNDGVLVPFAGFLGMFFHATSLGTAVNPEAAPDVKTQLVVPGAGSSSISRFLIVGKGDSADIFEGINTIRGRDSEFIRGDITTLTVGSEVVPAVGADIAVLANGLPFAHFVADANGQFQGALPPGSYQLAVNMAGHPYLDEGSAKPELTDITVGAKQNRTQSFTFSVPAAGLLRLFVKNMSARETKDGLPAEPIEPLETPLAGHVLVTRQGGDPSPDAMDVDSVNVYPFRPAANNVVTVGPSGEISIEVEPGEYSLAGFHGPDFSIARTSAKVKAAGRVDRVLELARVVSGNKVLAVEFGAVKDGGLSATERILSALAEGIELFVGSDVGGRADMAEALVGLNRDFGTGENPTPVSRAIAVATGERVATSGYGSFAAWPILPGAIVNNDVLGSNSALPMGGAVAWDNGDDAALPPADIIAQLMKLNAEVTPVVVLDYPYAPTGSADFGYLDLLDLEADWKTGTIAPGSGAVSPVEAGLGNIDPAGLWTDQWELFNVMPSNDPAAIGLSLNAWFAMLNVSLRPDETNSVPLVIAVGSQTGTSGVSSVVGGPRNLLVHSVTNLDQFRTDFATSMLEVNGLLRAARNVVTNGPSVSLKVTNGGSKSAAPGDLLSLYPAKVAVYQVSVTTPCWMKIDQIDIFSNTVIVAPKVVNQSVEVSPAPVSTFTTPAAVVKNGRSGLTDPDFASCPVDGTGFGRVEISVQDGLLLSRDAWIVAVVRGNTPMPNGAKPFAVTNPVFVDFLGNSEFDKLCPGADCPNGSGRTSLGWYSKGNADVFLP